MKRARDKSLPQQRIGAEQPAQMPYSRSANTPSTAPPSLRVCAQLESTVAWASSANFRAWRDRDQTYRRKSPSSVVGNISSAVRCAFESCAEEPAAVDRITSLEILVSWLYDQAENHSVEVNEVKELLFQLIDAEHRLYRFKKILEKADAIPLEELTTEKKTDREVLREALILIVTEQQNAKKAVVQYITGQSTSSADRPAKSHRSD